MRREDVERLVLLHIILKFMNLLPKKLLLFVGYSKIGSKIIKIIKKSRINLTSSYEIGFGVKMYVDLVDPHTWNLALGKDDETMIKKIFLDRIKENSTVIDVGAHVGEFSLIASKKIGPTGKLISIEPFEKAAEQLRKNFLLNGFSNYVILQEAIGQRSGKKTIYENEIRNGAYLDPILYGTQLSNTTEITVETIDDIISSKKIEKVDVLKIDVDGFEYEVLTGCKESFKEKKICSIICEVHFEHLRKKGLSIGDINKILKDSGFVTKELEQNRDGTIHILATIKE